MSYATGLLALAAWLWLVREFGRAIIRMVDAYERHTPPTTRVVNLSDLRLRTARRERRMAQAGSGR